MASEVRWITSTVASGLHLAASATASPTLEPVLRAVLAGELADLNAALVELQIGPDEFFSQAIPLVVQCDEPHAWATTCLKKLGQLEPTAEHVATLERALRALSAAVDRCRPNLHEELEHRSVPLRESWEARGPGLLATVARLTAAQLVVAAADVILVLPILGGGGQAFAAYNSLTFEALLTNPHERLPEVLRLGWLWSQLNLDLPAVHETLSPARGAQVGRLALVPAMLAAGEDVELTHLDERTLAEALAAWRAPAVAATLWNWWETYRSTSPAWPVALAALDRMLEADVGA